jgi:two-component system, cell cycle response regulator DivK
MKILLVDDLQDTREIIRGMVETLGHQVIEAESGNHAVHLAVSLKPDCILMDLNMPGVDGLLATAAVRAISPLRRVPIVALTAYPQDMSREKALQAGCDGYLQKPFSIVDLEQVLYNVFGEA